MLYAYCLVFAYFRSCLVFALMSSRSWILTRKNIRLSIFLNLNHFHLVIATAKYSRIFILTSTQDCNLITRLLRFFPKMFQNLRVNEIIWYISDGSTISLEFLFLCLLEHSCVSEHYSYTHRTD